MKNCKYCAQLGRMDNFGYCKKYNCFERSGEKNFLESLVSRARNLWYGDRTMQISGPASNFYSRNHRIADDLKWEATNRWEIVPLELIEAIPTKFRHKKWDRNIKW